MAQLERLDGAVVPEPVLGHLSSEAFEGHIKREFGSIEASIYAPKKISSAAEVVRRLDASINNYLGKP